MNLVINLFLYVLLFHFIFGIVRTAVAACICTRLISWSLTINLLVLGSITLEKLTVGGENGERSVLSVCIIEILRKGCLGNKGIISVVLIKLLEQNNRVLLV